LPDVKVVGLIGNDCDDENDSASAPGGCDRGTMGGCGSDRCSGQSIKLSVAELGRIFENGDEESIADDEGGGRMGCKERGRVKRKEEEVSSKEHDERRNNGAPPRRDHTNPPQQQQWCGQGPVVTNDGGDDDGSPTISIRGLLDDFAVVRDTAEILR